ncbi:hypothetical protein TNCV_674111 [Trichonephila clavipes]|uniref:Uncharacterized protein n=1 Tax=Trichonephila clavipes TaxID=2585209 RepID=A0A8X7BI59_TRICX|nr:hypothetical protein TNCV_674111 [Trichonephila clavipes]
MLLSSSPIFLGLNTVSRMFAMGCVPCRGDRYYSLPGVATDIASETHDHRMMMREHFGQQLHNTFFSVGVEVNDLGWLQAVDNDSKMRHKRNEIREMDSLVFDQVYLKCFVGLHIYEATGF